MAVFIYFLNKSGIFCIKFACNIRKRFDFIRTHRGYFNLLTLTSDKSYHFQF